MNTQGPTQWLSASTQRRVFILCSSLAFVVLIILQILDQSLITKQAPLGIVSFELAGDFDTSQQILSSWTGDARIYAGLSLGLDFLFLSVYPIAIGLGCVLVAKRLQGRNRHFALVGLTIAWAQLGAGVMDVIENIALIQLLLGSEQQAFSYVAYYGALVKFSVVALGLLYASVGFVMTSFTNAWSRKRP